MIDAFDALLAADTAMQRQRQIRELRTEIRAVGTMCGDCDHWMKSRSCPRERNVGGMSRGPSNGDLICSKFRETTRATAHRASLEQKLKEMEAEAL